MTNKLLTLDCFSDLLSPWKMFRIITILVRFRTLYDRFIWEIFLTAEAIFLMFLVKLKLFRNNLKLKLSQIWRELFITQIKAPE